MPTGPERTRLSAIIACYRDAPAVPEMHERLTAVFTKLGVEYEIIFVNDASPDDAEEVLTALVARDPHVTVVNHARNFGSKRGTRLDEDAEAPDVPERREPPRARARPSRARTRHGRVTVPTPAACPGSSRLLASTCASSTAPTPSRCRRSSRPRTAGP
jgi:cellulose synthase/poly-beta-1,6-N-acetylglucosamine synthase-like glycosyltransferase